MHHKRKQILLVDDDLIIDFLHKKVLRKAGLTTAIETVYNGKEALEKLILYNETLQSSDSVLVLLDLNMPILDGWGFLNEFEKLHSQLNYEVEIFILSSSTNTNDINLSINNRHVKNYLSKPLSLESAMAYF